MNELYTTSNTWSLFIEDSYGFKSLNVRTSNVENKMLELQTDKPLKPNILNK